MAITNLNGAGPRPVSGLAFHNLKIFVEEHLHFTRFGYSSVEVLYKHYCDEIHQMPDSSISRIKFASVLLDACKTVFAENSTEIYFDEQGQLCLINIGLMPSTETSVVIKPINSVTVF